MIHFFIALFFVFGTVAAFTNQEVEAIALLSFGVVLVAAREIADAIRQRR